MLLDELTPPLVKKIIRKAIKPVRVYDSHDKALEVIGHQGYDNQALIDLIYAKTKNYIQEINQHQILPLATHHLFLLSVIGIMQKSTIKVLDFGGAFGTHYFLTKAFYPNITFDWTVIELPQLVHMGQNLENDELKFLDIQNNFEDPIGSFDLVLTSGALQHMPNPEQTLSFLAKHQANYIALLRLGVNLSAHDLWAIHRVHLKDCGPGKCPDNPPQGIAAFPFCLMSEQGVKRSLNNYEVVLSCVEQSGTIALPGYDIRGFNNLYQFRGQA
ncbi:MAG: methyltransferase, TIGR04325 family [Proteobacteria bacterium]|nr:methyltransferase, TIGR04325 family [Pseudomonadota bacterium]